MPVDGAPLAMGGGREGGPEGTRGGDTPTGSGGRGMGGTPARGGAMEAKGGIPDGGETLFGEQSFPRRQVKKNQTAM